MSTCYANLIYMKFYPMIAAVLLMPFLSAKDKKDAPAVPDVSVEKVSFGTQVNDAAFDAKALAGKVLVVESWGVRCPPCIASLPEMQSLSKSGAKKGLVVVGLEAQNSSNEDILKVLKSARVTYPVMKGGDIGVAHTGIPHAAIYGVDGKLLWHGHPGDADFKRKVKEALRAVKK
jgi:thiol-disulfide isomerase/thioredoxin